MLGGMRREAGTGPQQATSSISPSPTRFSRNNHGLRGYRRLTVGGEVMALDDARVQDIRDGYESRIADLEATVAALREGHADADTALLEACRGVLDAMLYGLHWHDRKRETACPSCEDAKTILVRLNERLEE